MHIDVLSICRRPPRWVSELTDDYTQRLPRDFSIVFKHLAPGPDSASAAVRKRDEAGRLLKRIADSGPLIALDEHGWSGTSGDFAARLGQLREQHRRLTLVIGGADGLDQSVLSCAFQRWSLSALTLPHLLVQVVLAEQLYRAWTILERHPYHRV